MRKLVLFGDSILGRCDSRLIVRLESTLDNEYEVYNCAFGGCTSADAVKKSSYISTLQPDVVLVSLGTVDAMSTRGIDLEKTTENLDKIIKGFGGVKIIFIPAPPVDESTNKSIECGLLNKKVKQYHDKIIEIASSNHCGFIDTFDLFLSQPNDGYHIDDGVHLSRDGYTKLFSAIKDML